MEKNFDDWNLKKQIIHTEATRRFYRPREIWWCALGVNVGFEQDGVGERFDRPIIVIQKFNKDIFLGAALTTAKKKIDTIFLSDQSRGGKLLLFYPRFG